MDQAVRWVVPFVALGCSASTSAVNLYTPPTGITVRGDALFDKVGCGGEPDQVYRYLAVATNQDNVTFAGTYECFANAVFVELPASEKGSTLYSIRVLGFSKAEWNAERGTVDGIVRTIESTLSPISLDELRATFHATCTAEQLSGVQALAACEIRSENRNDAGP